MANTIDAALKQVAFGRAALNAFVGAIAPLTAFTTDFSSDKAEGGDTIQVKYLPAASAALQKDADTGYTFQDSVMQKKTLTFAQPYYVSWYLEDFDKLNTVARVEDFAQQKAFQLAKKVFQTVTAQITAANYGAAAFTGLASTFDSSDVIDIKTVVDAAGTPEAPRSIVLDSAYYNQLLKDGSIKDASAFGTETLMSGKVPNLAGFRPYGTTLLPGNGENLVGFTAFPSGILVAAAVHRPADPSAFIRYEEMVDEKLGLVITYKEWYDKDLAKTKCVMECMLATAVGEAAAIKRLVSA